MDRTASVRMARYRAKLAAEKGMRRLELRVAGDAAAAVKAFARRLNASAAARRDPHARRLLGLALGTINAPRPRPIDGATLLACLGAAAPDRAWRPHVEAFFTELSPDLIHDLVLTGLFTFEDLDRARRSWRIRDGRTIGWIAEMADLELAGLAAAHPADSGGPAG